MKRKCCFRSCYRKSLALAEEYGIRSIAFPLISTGGFGYPKEEGMRITVDEIHVFLPTRHADLSLLFLTRKQQKGGETCIPIWEAYDRSQLQSRRDVKKSMAMLITASSIAREKLDDEELSPAQICRYREERRWRRLSKKQSNVTATSYSDAAQLCAAGGR